MDLSGTGGQGGGGAGGRGGRDGSGGDGAPIDVELGGTWVATKSPNRLLRYADGDDTPRDTIELDRAAKYVEIIDGAVFYIESPYVLGDVDLLRVIDLETGEREGIEFSEESTLDSLIYADGSLWVADEALDAIWRVNPSTREVVGGAILGFGDDDINDGLELAAGNGSIFATSLFGYDTLARYDIASEMMVASQHEGGDGPTGVAFGAGSVWATSRFDGTLWRYDPTDLSLQAEIPLGADISAMTRNVGVAMGSVWVLAGVGGNAQNIFGQEARPGLFVVDAATDAPVTHIPLDAPRGLRVSEDAIWVTTEAAALRIDPARHAIARTLSPPEGQVVDVAFARTGGGTGTTPGKPAIDVYDVVEPPAQICEGFSPFPNHADDPIYGDGTATLGYDAESVALQHGTCGTLRDESGAVTAYYAHFHGNLEETEDSVTILVAGYTGEGSYDGARLLLRHDGSSTYSGTLAVGDGGLSGRFENAAGSRTVDFACDADADVALDSRPLVDPEPGHAYFVDDRGIVYPFDNVDCTTDVLGDELTVSAPTDRKRDRPIYQLFVNTYEAAEAGTHEGYADAVFFMADLANSEAEVVLSCGEDAPFGTFEGPDYRGAFACP